MIVAIIIMTILIVFTFSLILVAYTLYASQNKNVASLRCSEAANTLSVALKDELTYEDLTTERYPEADSYLYRYIRCNICHEETWPYYVSDADTTGHNKASACRYFSLRYNPEKEVCDENGKSIKTPDESGNPTTQKINGVEGYPGKADVCIYWMLPDGVELDEDDSLENISKDGIRLFIEVTCESANQSYTAKKEYVLKVEDYDLLNSIDRTDSDRYSILRTKINDSAVNPIGYTEEQLGVTEKWIWLPVNGD